jgi:uncharacterized membrane protein
VLLATFYDWLLLVHILAAMVWLGGVAVLSAIVTHIVRPRDFERAGQLLSSLRVVGPLLLAPAPAILLGAGIWLVLRGGTSPTAGSCSRSCSSQSLSL